MIQGRLICCQTRQFSNPSVIATEMNLHRMVIGGFFLAFFRIFIWTLLYMCVARLVSVWVIIGVSVKASYVLTWEVYASITRIHTMFVMKSVMPTSTVCMWRHIDIHVWNHNHFRSGKDEGKPWVNHIFHPNPPIPLWKWAHFCPSWERMRNCQEKQTKTRSPMIRPSACTVSALALKGVGWIDGIKDVHSCEVRDNVSEFRCSKFKKNYQAQSSCMNVGLLEKNIWYERGDNTDRVSISHRSTQ